MHATEIGIEIYQWKELAQRIEIERLYHRTKSVVRKAVWQFIKVNGYPRDSFEEFFSEAKLSWLKAYYTFNPDKKSLFTTWVWNQVTYDLLHMHRNVNRHRYNRQCRDPERQRSQIMMPVYAVEIADGLPPQSIAVINAIQESILEITELVEHCSRKQAARRVFKFLRETSTLTRSEILEGFRGLRQVVSQL